MLRTPFTRVSLIALPVLTAVFGLQHAVGLMTIPLIVTNAWQVWRFRAEAQSPRLGFMPWFLLGGALGIVLGTWALTSLPERLLVLGLGLILLGLGSRGRAAEDGVLQSILNRREGEACGIALRAGRRFFRHTLYNSRVDKLRQRR